MKMLTVVVVFWFRIFIFSLQYGLNFYKVYILFSQSECLYDGQKVSVQVTEISPLGLRRSLRPRSCEHSKPLNGHSISMCQNTPAPLALVPLSLWVRLQTENPRHNLMVLKELTFSMVGGQETTDLFFKKNLS